ncbi:MAG TPA: Rap1a/Tai family immunity protein [Pseudolabrys sp.]|nr:Rap1a/Tai family immunity protein [Pseudolabrys sp.]
MSAAILTALVGAATLSAASAQWSPRKADAILNLCDSQDPKMTWMLLGYITGVMDKAFMDETIAEAFAAAGNLSPPVTSNIKTQIVGYCVPSDIAPGDVRKALCNYRRSHPHADVYLTPEWIQDALKRAYPCAR